MAMTGATGHWTGSARMLGAWSTDPVNTSAVLAITPGRIELRVRFGIMRAIKMIENVSLAPDDGIVLSPARQTAASPTLRRQGVALRIDRALALHSEPGWTRRGGGDHVKPHFCYFWTEQREQVLAIAAAAGFRVSTDEVSVAPHDSGNE
jgi:hypothetical protein